MSCFCEFQREREHEDSGDTQSVARNVLVYIVHFIEFVTLVEEGRRISGRDEF